MIVIVIVIVAHDSVITRDCGHANQAAASFFQTSLALVVLSTQNYRQEIAGQQRLRQEKADVICGHKALLRERRETKRSCAASTASPSSHVKLKIASGLVTFTIGYKLVVISRLTVLQSTA